MIKNILPITVLAILFTGAARADEPQPIKIGEMMSYANAPNFATPYKEGWQLAVEEANAKGGIIGRKIVVVSQDDKSDPAEAVRVAEEFVQRDHVDLLFGAGFDHVGLAVGNFANKNSIPFVKMWGGKCEKVGDPANRYWFISIPCIDVYGALYAREVAKLPYKRWAIIAPNYEFGRNVSNAFKTELLKLRPDVTFVAERWPTLGKIKAQEEINALTAANPEAVFNQLFESDLVQYARMAEKLDFYKNRFHIGNYLGDSMNIRQMGDAYPIGWFTAGLPDDPGDHPASAFFKKYETRYNHKPSLASLEGYTAMSFALEGIRKAGSTDHEAVATALVGVKIDSPFGPLTMRKDHQPRQGYWLGYTDRVDGKGRFVNWKWKTPEELYPEADGTP